MKLLYLLPFLTLASCRGKIVYRVRSLEGKAVITHVYAEPDLKGMYQVGDSVYVLGNSFCDSCNTAMAFVIERIANH